MALRTRSEVLRQATDNYLSQYTRNTLPKPAVIQNELLDATRNEIEIENAGLPKGSKYPAPRDLEPAQIADILCVRFEIRNISLLDSLVDIRADVLGVYMEDGPLLGTYNINSNILERAIKEYRYTIGDKECKEVLQHLKNSKRCPHVIRTLDKDLIPVNNGIFDYRSKQLLPFSPDYIYLNKSPVDYKPGATNINIHNPDDNTDWDTESWFQSLSDDPEIVKLLWEITGAIIRPHVSWNKTALLYSTIGNNGKGTLCELWRHLAGPSSCEAIQFKEFRDRFTKEKLLTCTTIITDENDVGVPIDRFGDVKSLITHDKISIDRKFEKPITYRFHGFMVQCINEFPIISDKTNSMYRRLLFVPMDKSFEGIERKYIKDDYLKRQEVLEYVMKKVLESNFYELSEPAKSQSVKASYKEFNDNTRAFFFDLIPQTAWNDLPYDFLYELYKAWFQVSVPDQKCNSERRFRQELDQIVATRTDFESNKQFRTDKLMTIREPLILKYNLKSFMPNVATMNPAKLEFAQFSQNRARGISYIGIDKTQIQ